jgi:hypothetical protein
MERPMTAEELRLECLRLAVDAHRPIILSEGPASLASRASVIAMAEEFAQMVQGIAPAATPRAGPPVE